MLSDSPIRTEELPQPDKLEIAHTAEYNGKQFHLHQIVHTSGEAENESPEEMVVIGLDDGLKLADTDFEWEHRYPSGSIPESIEPQVAADQTPIFGY